MNQRNLFTLWCGLFIVCAGLGFIPEPAGSARFVLTALSLLFFVPGGMLLYRAGKEGDRHTLKLIRNLAALSLGLTAALLVLNFLTALRSEILGTILSYVLIIVSSPMVCSGYWALSLFLWACLLMGSMKILRER